MRKPKYTKQALWPAGDDLPLFTQQTEEEKKVRTVSIQPDTTAEALYWQYNAAVMISSRPQPFTLQVGETSTEAWAYRPRADSRIIISTPKRNKHGEPGRLFTSVGVKGSERGQTRRDGFATDAQLEAMGRNLSTGGIIR